MITRVLLSTPNANTPVDLIDGVPNLSSFTEPTLSILQAAFDAGELEVIPDPEPFVEPVQPNWDGFYDALIMSDVYNYLLMQTIPYPSISGVMAVMGFAITRGQPDPSNPDKLAALQAAVSAVLGALNAIQQPLTTEQLESVRGLLDSNGFEEITL